MKIEHRNAVYTASGAIDIELNHPVHGWVPFTASPDDVEPFGRHVFNEVQGGSVAAYSPPETPDGDTP